MISPVVASASRAGGGARMRAWRVHGYGAGQGEGVTLEWARVPALRAPDEALVRVRAASLNPLDVAMARGYGARVLNALRACEGAGSVEFPLVCGRDFVGEVVAAGAGTRLRRGVRVWGVVPPHRAGAHAQYVLVRDRWVSEAPALPDAQCGGAPYAALTACAALRAAGLGAGAGAGARVLVLGLGGVGQALVQLAAARGARVSAVCARDQLELAAALGAVAVHERGAEAAAAAAGPYRAVVDCAGLGARGAGAWAGRDARYVTLSAPLLRETDAHGLALGAARALALLAADNWRAAGEGACSPRVRWAFFDPRASDLEELKRLADGGRFRVHVERVFPWWEGAGAYARAGEGHARGKLLLDWTAAAPPPPDPDPAH